jgi:hypothetical protein
MVEAVASLVAIALRVKLNQALLCMGKENALQACRQ